MGVFRSRNDLLVRTADGRHCVLQEPLEYVTSDGVNYRVPVGADCDGASTPAQVWNILPPFGPWWLASVLHDAGYRGTLERMEGIAWVPAQLARTDVDLLFLEAMSSLCVDEFHKRIIYDAVVAFGGRAFKGST